VCLLLGWTTPSRGTTGGPDVAEVLGWDPVDKKIFVAIHHYNESSDAPTVFYFDLRKGPPSRPVAVRWSLSYRDSSQERRLDDLRRRLRPLRSLPHHSLLFDQRTVKRDSVLFGSYHWPRHRFTALVDNRYHIEVVTYEPSRYPEVRLLSLFEIPESPYELGIVSIIGVPVETGYEAHVPVLFGVRETTLVEPMKYRP
jgi:hypothetical protein